MRNGQNYDGNAIVKIDEVSDRMRRRWAKSISDGVTKPVLLYVGGQWSLNVTRGGKRSMRISVA